MTLESLLCSRDDLIIGIVALTVYVTPTLHFTVNMSKPITYLPAYDLVDIATITKVTLLGAQHPRYMEM